MMELPQDILSSIISLGNTLFSLLPNDITNELNKIREKQAINGRILYIYVNKLINKFNIISIENYEQSKEELNKFLKEINNIFSPYNHLYANDPFYIKKIYINNNQTFLRLADISNPLEAETYKKGEYILLHSNIKLKDIKHGIIFDISDKLIESLLTFFINQLIKELEKDEDIGKIVENSDIIVIEEIFNINVSLDKINSDFAIIPKNRKYRIVKYSTDFD